MSDLFQSPTTTLEDLLNLKKYELVAYLRKHNEKISGSKRDLATRILHCIQSTLLSPPASVGNDGSDKSTCIKSDATKTLPSYGDLTSGWTSDLSFIPKITVSDIEYYLIDSRSDDSKRMECYRQYIRGLNFYKEKFIHKIMYNSISENKDFCYIRSKCFPSMKQGEYSQWILMSKSPPVKILKAYCSCPAGLGEACTHISGLLFAIEGNGTSIDDIACTSKPCEWNKPSKRKKQPKPVADIQFKRIKLLETPDVQQNPKFKEKTTSDSLQNDFRNKLCAKLENSDAVIFHLLPQPVYNFPVESDLNVGMEVVVTTSSIITHPSDEYIDIKNTLNAQKPLSCEQSLISELEQRTRGQRENPLWIECRKGRITASIFHDVYKRKENTTSNKLIDKILGNTKNDNCVIPAIQWGNKMEKVAMKHYKAYMKLKYKQNVKILEQGLHLHKDFYFLSASPDGIVECDGDRYLIEVKCPYKYRNKSIKEACKDSDFYCYIDKNNQLKLKDSHRYYTQVQGQMAICGFEKCDFVMYTMKDIQIVSVKFNFEYWKQVLPILLKFYEVNVKPCLLK